MPTSARRPLLVLLTASALAFAGCLSEEPADPPVTRDDAGATDGGSSGDPDSGTPGDPDGGQTGLDAGLTGPAVTFKVMTWNVHDLFDETDAPGKDDDVYSASKVGSKLSALAAVIKSANPDVLTLQEVETEDLLRRLDEKLGSASLPNYRLIPTYDSRGINVAIMSRFPLTQVVSHISERFYHPNSPRTFTWPRDCLEAHLDLGGNREVVVLVNHFTSALSDADGMEREAQAMEALRIATALRTQNPLVPVLVTGDFNSDEGSRPVQILTESGAFVDVGMKVGASNRWTYEYRSDLQRLDYVLPDSSTARLVDQVYFVHGSSVDSASDHQPVTVTLTY